MSRRPESAPEAQVAPGQNVAAQGGVVAGMTLLSRVSGFVRDIVLSYVFGASGMADAFFVAFRIPNFFRRLFAEGAFNQAFVPVLARFRAADGASLRSFVAVMSGNLGIVLLSVVVAGVLLAPGLIAIFAPGFWARPERFELATGLVRITFPYLGFISLTAFAGALLNSHHRYAIPAFTPVLLNLSLIGAALAASVLAVEPVFALAWGVFLAGIAQLLFQLPPIRRLGLLLRPRVDFRDDGARRVGKLLLPAVFASSVSQINALIDTMLASMLVTGSISWLYYSDRLLELPIGLVAVALGTVLLPNLSRLTRSEDSAGFGATLDWGLRMGLLFGLPASVGLYVLALPLISTIYMHGALTEIDALMAALSLQAFAAGLVPLVLVKILAPAYFAHEDTTSPFRVGVVSVGVNIAVNLALFRIMGHVGLALGTTTAAWVNAGLLARGLLREERLRLTRSTGAFLLRCLTGIAAMVAVLVLLAPEATAWLRGDALERALGLAILVGAGGTSYLVVIVLCGVRPAQLLHRA